MNPALSSYGMACRGHDIGDVCDRLFGGVASAMSAFGQDRETGLEAKPASATAKPGHPMTIQQSKRREREPNKPLPTSK